jgi:hypothetical protein
MAVLENAVAGWITVFALLLMIVALFAYRRSGNVKVLGVAVAFALFFVKGLVVTIALFTETSLDTVWVPMGAFDTVILLAFYLSAVKQ